MQGVFVYLSGQKNDNISPKNGGRNPGDARGGSSAAREGKSSWLDKGRGKDWTSVTIDRQSRQQECSSGRGRRLCASQGDDWPRYPFLQHEGIQRKTGEAPLARRLST